MHSMSKRTQSFLFHSEYFWINAAHGWGVGVGRCRVDAGSECRQGLQEKNIVEV